MSDASSPEAEFEEEEEELPPPLQETLFHITERARTAQKNVREGYFAPVFVNGTSSFLNLDIIAQLETLLPEHLQGKNWMLIYSLLRHGASKATFWEQVRLEDHVLIIFSTLDGQIFGGYNATAWEHRTGYFGTGESWVFKVFDITSDDETSTGTSEKADKGEHHIIKGIIRWGWTGMNNYFMQCTESTLGMGGGGSGFAFLIGEDFFRGTTAESETYGNQLLTSSSFFQLSDVEIWGFTNEITEVAAKMAKLKDQKKLFSK